MKTLILGMGNPILGMDGVGILVARALEGRVVGADIKTMSEMNLEILEALAGYEKVYLIDAAAGTGKRIGDLLILPRVEPTLHLHSTHGLHFFELMRLGKELGYFLPESIRIFGIEIGCEVCFEEALTPEIVQQAESIAEQIVDLIGSEGMEEIPSYLS